MSPFCSMIQRIKTHCTGSVGYETENHLSITLLRGYWYWQCAIFGWKGEDSILLVQPTSGSNNPYKGRASTRGEYYEMPIPIMPPLTIRFCIDFWAILQALYVQDSMELWNCKKDRGFPKLPSTGLRSPSHPFNIGIWTRIVSIHFMLYCCVLTCML